MTRHTVAGLILLTTCVAILGWFLWTALITVRNALYGDRLARYTVKCALWCLLGAAGLMILIWAGVTFTET